MSEAIHPAEGAVVRQLRGIRIWVAIGAIGFLALGSAAVVMAVSVAWFTSTMEENLPELESDELSEFRDLAQGHFEQGETGELEALIARRAATHPNDANVTWFRARLNAQQGKWDDALSELRQTAFLAPHWVARWIRPLEEQILERQRGADARDALADPR